MAKQTSEWMTRLVEKYRIHSEKSKPIKILTEEQLKRIKKNDGKN